MNTMFVWLRNKTIGVYLEETTDVYEKARIRLLFQVALLSFLTLLAALPAIYLIDPLVGAVSTISLLLIGMIPLLLNYTRSVERSTRGIVIGTFIVTAIAHLMLNQPDVLCIVAWYIVIILVASFILGKRWGLGMTLAATTVMVSMVWMKQYGISLMGTDFAFRIDQSPMVLLTTPFHTFLPILLIYLVVLEFLHYRDTIDNHVRSIVVDQQKLYQQLQASEQKYRRFIEEADDLIYVIGEDGKFAYVNPIFIEALGFSLEELREVDLSSNVLEEYREAHRDFYRAQVKDRKPVTYYEFPFKNKDGDVHWLGQKVHMNFDGDRMEEALCIGRDITQSKQVEEDLIKTKEEAVKASQAKAQFLSSMSHEIRTPMNAVIGMTHLLLQDCPRPDQLENINTLKFSGENLLTIINDILDFSKIEAGKIEFEEVDFNLRYIVKSIHHALSSRAEDRGINLHYRYDAALPDFVKGDPVRLSQVLNNLVGNAIKFTSKGHVMIQISQYEAHHDYFLIDFSVMDTGIGIPPDRLNAIFDNFTQASTDTTRNFGGTGLGLAITRQLLELQGSKIQVESIVGKGSRFYFRLRLKRSNQVLRTESKFSQKEVSVDALVGLQVLLVEDNRVNQVVAGKFLSKWGIEVTIADNGVIAIEKVQEKYFDIVLMDLQMPVMGGFEATRKIRALGKEFANLPIIALTASAILEVHDEAIGAGMDDFVTKPFDPVTLHQKIQAYVPVGNPTNS